MNIFQKGDAVRLKTGGPQFTVTDVGDFRDLGGTIDGVRCIRSVKKDGQSMDELRMYDATSLMRVPETPDGGEYAISDYPILG